VSGFSKEWIEDFDANPAKYGGIGPKIVPELPPDKRKLHLQLEKQTVAIDSAREIPSWLHWANTSNWDTEPCPEREWAIKDRMPLRQVTLFSGEGAIGKSIVELMCSVAHVVGGDWLGSLPEPGGAFYIGCEDDDKELRIRLVPIVRHYKTQAGHGFEGFSQSSLASKPHRHRLVGIDSMAQQCPVPHVYDRAQAGTRRAARYGFARAAIQKIQLRANLQ
jgi:hypothetical protein